MKVFNQIESIDKRVETIYRIVNKEREDLEKEISDYIAGLTEDEKNA